MNRTQLRALAADERLLEVRCASMMWRSQQKLALGRNL